MRQINFGVRLTASRFFVACIVWALFARTSFGSEQAKGKTADKSAEASIGMTNPPDPDRPPPPAPLAAVLRQDFEPLSLTITADREGVIKKVEISKPAKPKDYHQDIRDWVEAHWKMPPAGPQEPELRKFIAPIVFDKKSMPRGKFPDPPYPRDFLVHHITGSVTMEIDVASSGAIRAVNVIHSSHNKELDKYAVAWVKVMWRFPPGYPGLYRYPLNFMMN